MANIGLLPVSADESDVIVSVVGGPVYVYQKQSDFFLKQ